MMGLQKPPAPLPRKKLPSLKTTVASAAKHPAGTAVIVRIRVQTKLMKAQKTLRIAKNQKQS